jgi:hypothetical protein
MRLLQEQPPPSKDNALSACRYLKVYITAATTEKAVYGFSDQEILQFEPCKFNEGGRLWSNYVFEPTVNP